MKYLDLLAKTNYWGKLKKPPGKLRPEYVNRLILQRQSKNVSAVLGVRRAGKSTILQHTLYQLIQRDKVKPSNTLLVNLEDPRLVELLSGHQLFSLIDEFKARTDQRSPVHVVLDEVGNLQNWEAIIRTLLDQGSHLKLYLTGSSAQLLGKELGTKLAGRYLKTEVFPFSFQEFSRFTTHELKMYVNEGGFPDPALTNDATIRHQLLKDYYDSILLRDIMARYNIRDDFKLRRLSAQLFTNIANQASSYRLSKDLDVSSDTVLQYFSYIEDAYLGFFVPKLSQSVRKQIYNPKKFYAIDNGLQSAVAFRVMDDLGKLFENTVFLGLRRHFEQIFYWSESKEVDFIVKDKDQVKFMINACVSLKQPETKRREIDSLTEAMYHLDTNQSYLITMKGAECEIPVESGTIFVKRFEHLEKLLKTQT